MNWFILLSKEHPSSESLALFSNASKIVKPLLKSKLRIINLFESQQIIEFPEGVLDFYLRLYYPAYSTLSPKIAQTVLGEITERLKNPSIFKSYILPLLPANAPSGNYIVAINAAGHFVKKLDFEPSHYEHNASIILPDYTNKEANIEVNASQIAAIKTNIANFLVEILGEAYRDIYPIQATPLLKLESLEKTSLSQQRRSSVDTQSDENISHSNANPSKHKPDSDSLAHNASNIHTHDLNATKNSLIKKIYHFVTARKVDFSDSRDLHTVVNAYDITFPNEEVLHFLEQVQKHKLELGLVQLLDAVLSKVNDTHGFSASQIGEKGIFSQEIPTLVIDSDYKIFLQPNGQILKLDPLHNSLYLLFLSHPDGIYLPSMGGYKNKLLELYKGQSDRENLSKIEKSVARICNLRDNSIFEKISRINSVIKSTLGEIQVDPSAYYISGERGKPKSIKLPPEKLKWPDKALF